jgi:hypothetical protein
MKQEIAEHLDAYSDVITFRLLEKSLAKITTEKVKRAQLLRSHFQAAADANDTELTFKYKLSNSKFYSPIKCTLCGFINRFSNGAGKYPICIAPYCKQEFWPKPLPLLCVNFTNPGFKSDEDGKHVVTANTLTYKQDPREVEMYRDGICNFRCVEVFEDGSENSKGSKKFIRFDSVNRAFARAHLKGPHIKHKISVRYLWKCNCVDVDIDESDATPMSCEVNQCIFSPWSEFTRPVNPMTCDEVHEVTGYTPGFLSR